MIRISPALASRAVCLGTLESKNHPPECSRQDIEAALLHPLWPREGRGSFFDVIAPGKSVCFVVSDHTRKTAADRVLPVILDGLAGKGCRPDSLSFLVASGIHRPPTPGEIETILGTGVARRFHDRIFIHDPDDEQNLVPVGVTRRGHTVRLNRRAVEEECLVLIGAATYHYHAGFGGGRKSLVPGLAARETIAYNHSLTLDPDRDRIRPGVEPGNLDGNPVAEEMLEGARMRPPDIIVNTALTPDGKLAAVFSGDLDLAHRAACRAVEKISRLNIAEPADIVLASAGTAANWIQSHKALFNASRAVREDGRIILLAPCPEGIGDNRFRHWVTRPRLEDIYAGLRKAPEVLGQTALSTRARGARSILVTQMPPDDVRDLGIRTAPDAETAFKEVLDELEPVLKRKPTYYLMPQAGQIVPFISRP